MESITKTEYNVEGKKSRVKDKEKFDQTKPRKFEKDDIVLVFVESASDSRISLAQVLRVMGQEPLSVPLTSVGFVQEEVCLQPTFVEAANKAMERLNDVLQSSVQPPTEVSAAKLDNDYGNVNAVDTERECSVNAGASSMGDVQRYWWC